MSDNPNAPFSGSAGLQLRMVDLGSGGPYAAVGFVQPATEASLGLTPLVSSALEASHVIKSSAGILFRLYVLNTSASLLYLMTFNATALPTNGSVTPIECVPVGPNQWGTAEVSGSMFPDVYSSGIVAGLSTTGPFTLNVASAVGFFKAAFL